MAAALLAIIAPVLVCAAAGYGWVRIGRPYDPDLVTSLVTGIGAPCLVFSTLSKLHVGGAEFLLVMLAALCVTVAVGVAAALALRLARLRHDAFLPALTFPNAGNMGLPLTLFAFGEPGLALAIAFFAVTSIGNFTAGVWIASGKASPLAVVRTPNVWAVALGLAVMLSETSLPLWLSRTVDVLGGLTIPLMLLTLGASLARLRVASLPRSVALAAGRLILGVLAGWAIATAFGFTGAARGVLIIQSAMPVAVFNYLFAQRYRTEPEEVAGMVLISTVLSFATLPLLLLAVLE